MCLFTCMHSRPIVEIKGWFAGISSVLQLCGLRTPAQGVQWHSVSWAPAADASSCPASTLSLAP